MDRRTEVDPMFAYQFRIILLGDSTVGKSSLLKFFTEGKFDDGCEPTVGIDFFARLIEIRPNVRVKLQLWDTAGQERFRSITRSYYRNCVGAILVYDITNRQSFDHLDEWFDELRLHIRPRQAAFAVVGHKSDMSTDQRAVSHAEGRRFAAQHGGLHFLETSAVTGENIEEVFSLIASDVYKMLERGIVKIEDGWDGVTHGFCANKTHVRLHLPHATESTDSSVSSCC